MTDEYLTDSRIPRNVQLLLQGHQIELSKLYMKLDEIKEALNKKNNYENIPAWVNLDIAWQLKGGCSELTLKGDLHLQPCCGTNYKLIGGRKCWKKEDVIEWLGIADSDLKEYAKKWRVPIKEKYLKRSA